MTRYIILGTGLIVFLIVCWKVAHLYTSWRLNRWTTGEGYKLVEFRGAKFFEGTKAWRRSENQDEYWIAIEDHSGRRREAWIVFGSTWGFHPGKVEVHWEE